MNALLRRRSAPRRTAPRRGMATYLYVTATAALVSLLALSASSVVRIERRQGEAFGNRLTARTLAHAAAELAFKTIKNDSSWRTNYASGVETAPTNLGAFGAGTVSWRVEDTDGSLTNADTQLRLKGIGRVGDAVQVASVQLQSTSVGPTLLRSLTSSGNNDEVRNDRCWAQYFRPTLPAEAHRWWVTSVEFYFCRGTGSQTFTVRLYRPNGSNMPSNEVLDEASFAANSVATSWSWHTYALSGVYSLDAAEGACLALETTSSSSRVQLQYVTGGVFAPHSALIRGTPAWSTYETDKGLRYRVNGCYTTASGVTRVSGSWRWDGP